MIKSPQLEEWTKKIGQRLRTLRHAQGLSLEDLSRLSGATAPTLSNIERGTRDVKLSTLVSLTAALRTELSLLFEESQNTDRYTDQSSDSPGYDLDDD